MSLNLNPREEIIFLMRGFFSTPIISTLGKLNVFKKLINKKFSLKEIKSIKNKTVLKYILEYFIYLDLISFNKNKYSFTKLGKKIFQRTGSFNIIHSYKDYAYQIEKILNLQKNISKCDRIENVIGSGNTNNRKFFPFVKSFVKKKNYDLVFDLGCGNGFFLNEIKKINSKIKVCGSDLSQKALGEAKKKLGKNTKFYKCDAHKVSKWARWLSRIFKDLENKKLLITIWFIIHEISKKSPLRIINFLKKINHMLPNSDLVIGEIIKPEYDLMKKNKYNSIMPEYMLFHNLSGQGVLSYKEFLYILKNIPYNLTLKKNFDNVKHKDKISPSAIAWLLTPKK